MLSQNEAVDALLSAGYSIGVEDERGIIMEKPGIFITVSMDMLHLNRYIVPKELASTNPLVKRAICISYNLCDCKLTENGSLILPDPCTYYMH